MNEQVYDASTQRPKNLQFVLRPTGRTRRITPEYGAAFELPEVELVERLRVNELRAFDNVCEVEGHGFFYLHEAAYEYDGRAPAVLICREAHAYDAGDNNVRTTTAPESTQGIAAPQYRGGPTLNKIFGDPVFAAPPGDYTGLLEA